MQLSRVSRAAIIGDRQQQQVLADSRILHQRGDLFFFSSRRRHTRSLCDWSSDVCSFDLAREAREVFLIGHAGHPEVEGTIGQFDASLGGAIYLVQTVEDVAALQVRNPTHVAFVTQTTLSVDDTASIVAALRVRFPGLKAPVKEDICYATQNRQDAVKDLIGRCEVLVVVGSKTSSNSNRLREMADKNAKPGYLVDGPEDL